MIIKIQNVVGVCVFMLKKSSSKFSYVMASYLVEYLTKSLIIHPISKHHVSFRHLAASVTLFACTT